jgi:hypothetical protein
VGHQKCPPIRGKKPPDQICSEIKGLTGWRMQSLSNLSQHLNSLPAGNFAGNSRKMGAWAPNLAPKNTQHQMLTTRIPYSIEQGKFFVEQGIFLRAAAI